MERRRSAGFPALLCAGWAALLALCGCHHADSHSEHGEEGEASRLVVSRPIQKDTLVTREYVCQIRSARNIEIRALEGGYLQSVAVAEGQKVGQGDPMFTILPLLHQAELKRAEAEAQAARVEFENTRGLAETRVVSETELAISRARFEKALAEVDLAKTRLGFTGIKAPFAGLVDRLHLREGSLVEEGDLLTTLSDNSQVWVYFNVPETDYLEYASHEQPEENKVVDLIMANGRVFGHRGRITTIEAEFNNETGTIAFRADFPNPDALLRHGETGTIRMRKLVRGAVLVPQKATFEILDHHYVLVVGEGDIIRQQRIRIAEELEDLFVVGGGLTEADRIVIEGLRQDRVGEKARYEFLEPEAAFGGLKLRAE